MVNASANFREVVIMALKAVFLVMDRIMAENSSRVLCICTAKDSWARAASRLNESVPDIATLRAFCEVSNCWISGITLDTCLKPPSSSIICENLGSVPGNSESAAFNLLTASYGTTNCPVKSCKSTPNVFKNFWVLIRCIRVKMVRKPVAILSADSRVVARTDVNKAINSFKSPPAALNAPPVRRIAAIISEDSTANFPATALIDDNAPSSSSDWILNCLNIATAPSVVLVILSNVGARSVLAKACKDFLVSSALKPAWAKVIEALDKSFDDAPNAFPNLSISKAILETLLFDDSVTWAILFICLSKSIASLTVVLIAEATFNTTPPVNVKATNLLKANAACSPKLTTPVVASLAATAVCLRVVWVFTSCLFTACICLVARWGTETLTVALIFCNWFLMFATTLPRFCGACNLIAQFMEKLLIFFYPNLWVLYYNKIYFSMLLAHCLITLEMECCQKL